MTTKHSSPEWRATARLIRTRVAQAHKNGEAVTWVNYARGDNRGAGIEQDRAHWYEGGPAGSGTFVWEDLNPAGYTNPGGGAGPLLKPGTRHYVYISSRNVRGWGPWAGPIDAETLAGGRAWDGSSFRNCRVRYWDGSTWRLCRVRSYDGSAWRNVR